MRKVALIFDITRGYERERPTQVAWLDGWRAGAAGRRVRRGVVGDGMVACQWRWHQIRFDSSACRASRACWRLCDVIMTCNATRGYIALVPVQHCIGTTCMAMALLLRCRAVRLRGKRVLQFSLSPVARVPVHLHILTCTVGLDFGLHSCNLVIIIQAVTSSSSYRKLARNDQGEHQIHHSTCTLHVRVHVHVRLDTSSYCEGFLNEQTK